uniref:Monooxygenase FAD-binding n=1 Tax=Variovorax paradoxus (strain S110) TaxID=543728 RepID=C5CKI7_VARPS
MQNNNLKQLPVAIVGAGPIGLLTALGLASQGVRCVVYEDDQHLSLDTKAGTLLSRTLEIFRRYGVADEVLAKALRVDEIGEIDRRTQKSTFPVHLSEIAAETRYPFVINLPQQDLEPILAQALRAHPLAELKLGHRLERYEDHGDHVRLHLKTADGEHQADAVFLLACDGGRSTVRAQMGVAVEGMSLNTKYALVDLVVDLDTENPRDYPYLAYFADPDEWMILVRHPHCWRFLYPMAEGAPEPTAEELRDKSLSFIGDVRNVELLNKVTYNVHHRVAQEWRRGRVFLMGDAAHLITPMWALGLNTGALDASNLPWRLAWYLRGWADMSVLDGYEREQRPLAIHGSGEMAEAARQSMAKRGDAGALSDNNWSNACTRTMLGVTLDVEGKGQWSMVVRETRPGARAGARLPDYLLHTPEGRQERAHDLCSGRFTALYFSDVRRRPAIPVNGSPALRHWVVSRYDAPHDSGLRDRSLLDPGNALMSRLGVAPGTLVLVRPDEYIAAIVPMDGSPDQAAALYEQIVGMVPTVEKAL